MRCILFAVIMLVAACTLEHGASGLDEASQDRVGVETLTFDSEAARTVFLVANADRIVARVAFKRWPMKPCTPAR
jgi:hypothetical protein